MIGGMGSTFYNDLVNIRHKWSVYIKTQRRDGDEKLVIISSYLCGCHVPCRVLFLLFSNISKEQRTRKERRTITTDMKSKLQVVVFC